MTGKKKYETLPLFLSVFLYIYCLLCYLFGYINSDTLVVAILLLLICHLMIMLRNKKYFRKRSLLLPLIAILVLLLYEGVFLLVADEVAYYVEPEEIIAGTNILSLPVGTIPRKNVEKEKLNTFPYFPEEETKQSPLEIYTAKNRAYCQLLTICEDDFEVMDRHIKAYLGKENHPAIHQFLKRSNKGNSAGLMLIVSQLVCENKIRNDEKIAITGAVTKNGKVQEVGMIREKVFTTSISEIDNMILPVENMEEALKTKEAYNFQMDIYGVSSVEEALATIEAINLK